MLHILSESISIDAEIYSVLLYFKLVFAMSSPRGCEMKINYGKQTIFCNFCKKNQAVYKDKMIMLL